MICAIAQLDERHELYYGCQDHTGLPDPQVFHYDVIPEKIERLRNCKAEEVQAIIQDIINTSRKI